MLNEIFYIKCLGCGTRSSGLPICPSCIDNLKRYEHYCESCGYPTKVRTKICGKCHSNRKWDKIFIPYRYTGAIKQLILSVKFSYRISGLNNIHTLIEHAKLKNYDIITDVPSHYMRKVRRFSHPAKDIAKGLGRECGFRYVSCLKRERKTEYQYKLKKRQRADNVRGAFQCDRNLSGLKVLLVDDIITTGSTINECCRILKKSGATGVDVFALAGGSVY